VQKLHRQGPWAPNQNIGKVGALSLGLQNLSKRELLELRDFPTYREGAAIFRLGRAKGVSLTTIDALIAAIALEHRASVFTLDKDFSRIARSTGLPLHPLPGL
jgi:predicted nucleic acid-binding protein